MFIVVDVNLNFCCACFWSFVELEAKEQVMEGMRLALSEQEDTQEQMEQVLEEKLNLIQELSSGKKQEVKRRQVLVVRGSRRLSYGHWLRFSLL